MKRIVLFCVASMLLLNEGIFAQTNVFNPNDPIVEYDSVHPPATPPANTLAKWVRTKAMNWNTDKFKCYYFNGMAFRLRYPNNYTPANSTKKYPLVLFMHGGGDIGPVTDNEEQLVHTAKTFEDIIDAGSFDAFLLYPQMSENDIWQDYHFQKINGMLDSLQKYCNIDQDKVLTMGLSSGGFGSIRFSSWYPQRSALVAGASPALIETMSDGDKNKLLHMPVWIGNGGLDVNPAPSSVTNFVNYMLSKGANLRQDYFSTLAHFTWDSMYDPNVVLPYWLTSHKANPTVFFGRTQFDQDVPISDRLGITAGFYEYEWQRNNVTIAKTTNGVNQILDPSSIANYNANEITVNTYGTYRVRFRRTAASALSDWSPNPVVIYNGVKYRFYQGSWTTLPDFSSLTPVASGTAPNITISSRPPNTSSDNFGFVWEGKIYISTPGTYTFETVSDDGSKLYFNTAYSSSAVALVNNDGVHPMQPATGTVNITTPGYYPIAVTFFEKSEGEGLEIYWTGPGIQRQQIPDEVFSRASVSNDNVAPSAPANLKATYIARTFADITWDNSTDNVGVSKYDVYVNNIYKLTTTTPGVTINDLTAGSTYAFTVKAYDPTGNVSAASSPLSITASANGLRYKYYQGIWSALPDFSALTPIKIGASPNVDISPRLVDDTFAFVWEGYINIKTPGTYTFETNSDDGSKLYFNTLYSPSAVALVNNDGTHPATSVSNTVNIPSAGLYPITMTFFEKDGGQSMQVYWSGPGFSRQLIPDAAFMENFQDNTPPTAPANLKSTYTGRTFVDLAWDNSTDNGGIARYDVYMNNSLKTSSTTASVSVSGLTAGSTYTFTVKAYDQAGNASASSNQVSVIASANGLRYKYYEGNWSALPDFSALTPIKTGATPNVDIVTPRRVNDTFAFVWEGYINIKTAGTYTFETISDDGSKLYFNTLYSPSAIPLVNNDGTHAPTSVSNTISITAAGLYPITMTFFEKDGGESMQVYWSGPGFSRQLIPDAAFVENFQDNTPPTAPANLKSTYTGRTFVDLAWDNSTDNGGIARYDVYMNGSLKTSSNTASASVSGLTAGSTYTFTVKAYDQAGNASASSNQISVTASANGLRYKYYQGAWSTLPDFSTLTPVKTGTTANVDISPRIDYDNFAFVWEGYINIKTPGTYTFETVSDDGSKLYFNTFYSPSASLLVNNDGLHAATSVSGTVNIPSAGLYPVAFTFFERTESESMQVYWSGPGFSRQPIPDAAFTENFSGSSSLDVPSFRATMPGILNLDKSSATSAYPNPFNKELRINFINTATDNNISVGLYDLSGRLVYNKYYGKLSPGAATLQLDLSGQSQLDAGTYIARLQVNGIPVKTWKLIKIKSK